MYKECLSGTDSSYSNSGWRDGKSFCECQRGQGKAVEEEMDRGAVRDGLPGTLL